MTMQSGVSWPSKTSSVTGGERRRLLARIGLALALYGLLRWGRLPLATPGYQGLPLMALLAWSVRSGAGRFGTPLAAISAALALWLGGPLAPAKALALPLLTGTYALAAGPATSHRTRAVLAGALYVLWPLLAGLPKGLAGGQGMMALLAAHAGFGLLGTALGVVLAGRAAR